MVRAEEPRSRLSIFPPCFGSLCLFARARCSCVYLVDMQLSTTTCSFAYKLCYFIFFRFDAANAECALAENTTPQIVEFPEALSQAMVGTSGTDRRQFRTKGRARYRFDAFHCLLSAQSGGVVPVREFHSDHFICIHSFCPLLAQRWIMPLTATSISFAPLLFVCACILPEWIFLCPLEMVPHPPNQNYILSHFSLSILCGCLPHSSAA